MNDRAIDQRPCDVVQIRAIDGERQQPVAKNPAARLDAHEKLLRRDHAGNPGHCGGNQTVRARQRPVEVRVEDGGPGLPEE